MLSSNEKAGTLRFARPTGFSRDLKWPIAVDRTAPHHALHVRLIEAGRAVPRAAVVPHHAFARAPFVGIHSLARRDQCVDLLDQRAAFVVVHAFDFLRMITKEDRLAA